MYWAGTLPSLSALATPTSSGRSTQTLEKENPILEDYIDEAVNGALSSTGVSAESIEKAWIGNFCGELFSNQGHLGAAVVGANTGLMHKPVMKS